MSYFTKPLLIIAILAIGAGAGPGPAAGQLSDCNSGQEIERAQFVLERALEVVKQSPIPEARELMAAARNRLLEAITLRERGRHQFACERARVAQSLAGKAAEMARRGIRGLEELERMLHQTDEGLRDAAAIVQQSESEEARRLLGVAVKQQKNAWSEFRNRNLRVALKLTQMARESATRARRVAEGGGPRDTVSEVRRELEQTDQHLQQARRVLEAQNGETGATEILEQAHRIQNEAWNKFRSGAPGISLRLTRTARAMARRALGYSDRTPEAADVQALIATTTELVEELRQVAVAADHKQAQRLLDRAENQLDKARRALGQRKLAQALGSARAASSLALDVSEKLDRGREEE